jgi:hypothetical protein
MQRTSFFAFATTGAVWPGGGGARLLFCGRHPMPLPSPPRWADWLRVVGVDTAVFAYLLTLVETNAMGITYALMAHLHRRITLLAEEH